MNKIIYVVQVWSEDESGVMHVYNYKSFICEESATEYAKSVHPKALTGYEYVCPSEGCKSWTMLTIEPLVLVD